MYNLCHPQHRDCMAHPQLITSLALCAQVSHTDLLLTKMKPNPDNDLALCQTIL